MQKGQSCDDVSWRPKAKISLAFPVQSTSKRIADIVFWGSPQNNQCPLLLEHAHVGALLLKIICWIFSQGLQSEK